MAQAPNLPINTTFGTNGKRTVLADGTNTERVFRAPHTKMILDGISLNGGVNQLGGLLVFSTTINVGTVPALVTTTTTSAVVGTTAVTTYYAAFSSGGSPTIPIYYPGGASYALNNVVASVTAAGTSSPLTSWTCTGVNVGDFCILSCGSTLPATLELRALIISAGIVRIDAFNWSTTAFNFTAVNVAIRLLVLQAS